MEDDVEEELLRLLGGSRHVCPGVTHHHTSPTRRLARRRRARPDPPPDLRHTSGSPRPGVQGPGPACSPSLHPDAGRSPLEWHPGHLAAPRPSVLLSPFDLPTLHLSGTTAWPWGALGTADLALDGTPPRHEPHPGWSGWGAAEPVFRPSRQSEPPVAGDPPRPLPCDQLPSGPQRG